MACYSPWVVHKGPKKENGKLEIEWNRKERSDAPTAMRLACGKCIGCRLDKAKEWAVRCVHESKMHDQNSFITLTYADENLPADGSVDPRVWQLFMKKLRWKVNKPLRYFHCGEYGAKLGRPHYHGLIFGYDFPDKRLWRTRDGYKLYRSDELEGIWKEGNAEIGDVTPESAGYVARYSLKKVCGPGKEEHYGGRKPEYITMSRMPGLGKSWYEQYKGDVFPRGELVFNGYKSKIPVFYENLYKLEDPERLDEIKLERRIKNARLTAFDVVNGEEVRVANNDSIRLAVRERVKLSQIKSLRRVLEE